MARPWILALCAVSCNDTSETGETAPTEDFPAITVSEESLDFGILSLGSSADRSVDVCNEGGAVLAISSVEVAQEGAPFSLSALTSPVLQPAECATVTVTFAPYEATDWSTKLWIHSNDPAASRVGVNLLGVGGSPVISVTPATTDFGSVWFKCSVEQDLVIANTGTSDLTVLGYTYDTDTKDLVFSGITDENGSADGLLTLAAGTSWTGTVTYAPTDADIHTGLLTVTSTDPANPSVQASQTGDGSPGGTVTDTYFQARTRAPDVLITVDRSSSMASEMASVDGNLDAFLNAMIDSRYDYQVAAVVDDSGCVRTAYNFLDNSLRWSEADPIFTDMLDLYADPGEYTQQGLRLLDEAIAAASGGCNTGMIREDSRLHIIGISDGPDQSPADWDTYLPAWQAMRLESDQLVVHAVGGDWPSGCTGAEAYDGFYQATMATEGVFLSICGKAWGKELAATILADVELRDTFELSEDAIAASISVAVNGKALTSGWTYDEEANAVRFTVAVVPEEGAKIAITYDVAGGC
jgi:hypothetical protein